MLQLVHFLPLFLPPNNHFHSWHHMITARQTLPSPLKTCKLAPYFTLPPLTSCLGWKQPLSGKDHCYQTILNLTLSLVFFICTTKVYSCLFTHIIYYECIGTKDRHFSYQAHSWRATVHTRVTLSRSCKVACTCHIESHINSALKTHLPS